MEQEENTNNNSKEKTKMCGRFSLTIDAELFEKIFGVINITNYEARYNIAPGQDIAVIRMNYNSERELAFLRWGLIPSWAKDSKIGYKMINARAETLLDKPSFKQAFIKRRCIIPADGFFEWKKEGSNKIPYYFKMNDSSAFAFAGLWETWHDTTSNKFIESCTIITTNANETLNPIHERMPVILDETNYSNWLKTDVKDLQHLKQFLKPFNSAKMECYEVNKNVNSSKINDFTLILPVNN